MELMGLLRKLGPTFTIRMYRLVEYSGSLTAVHYGFWSDRESTEGASPRSIGPSTFLSEQGEHFAVGIHLPLGLRLIFRSVQDGQGGTIFVSIIK